MSTESEEYARENGDKIFNQTKKDFSDRLYLLVSKLFYPLYSATVEKRTNFVDEVELALIQANKKEVSEIYLSARLGFGVLVGWFIGLFASILALPTVRDLTLVYTPAPSAGWKIATNWATVITGATVSTVLIFLLSGAIVGGLTVYISKLSVQSAARTRKKEINILLADVVAFMYCQSVGGMNRVDIIREVAAANETYGEVSTEFSRIVHSMDTFSEDPHTAIQRVAKTTPSDQLSEFFNDMLSSIVSGGRMDTFLETQLDDFLAEAKQSQDAELDKLEFFNEIYITISLLPVMVLIIMGFAGGMGVVGINLLLTDVYFIIPVLQMFALTVTTIVFTSDYGSGVLTPDAGDAFSYVKDNAADITSAGVAGEYREEGWLFEQIYVNELRTRLVNFLSDPITYAYQEPKYVFLVSAPLSIAFAIGGVLTGDFGIAVDTWVNDGFKTTLVSVYIPVMIAIVPYTAFYEIKNRRLGKITDGLTTDLNKLANTNEQGIPLRQSILITAQSGSSRLSDELERIYKKQQYGTPIGKAIVEVNNRYKIPRLARIFRIIKSSQEVSTNITDVLKTAANLSAAQDAIEKERKNRTRQQVGIIVVIFLVFLASIVMMQEFILGTVANSDAFSGSGLIPSSGNPIPQDVIALLFFHAGLIHGGLAGLLGGYIQTGEYSPGLKYTIGMMTAIMVVWFAL